MRIAPYVILLFASLSAHAQQTEVESSLNIEPRRSYTLPCSTAEEAAGDKSGAMRYAIPIGEWQEHYSAQGVTFTSAFEPPFSWVGRESFISVESASAPYSVWVGDKKVGTNLTPSIQAQFNVTDYLERGVENPILITMHHDAAISQIEGWSSADDELTLGDVRVLSQPTMYIRDVEVQTTSGYGVLNTAINVILKSEALNARTNRLNYELVDPQGKVAHRGNADVNIDMRQEDTIHIFAIIPDSLAWSAENPKLYRLNLSTQYRGRYIEYHSYDMGLRSIELSDGGDLVVNGEAQKLKIADVDQYVTTDRLAEIKRNGYNAIKISAGGYNREVYNFADSIGLYVISTAPIDTWRSGDNILRGGNPTNDPARLGQYIERTDAIYNITKIHPSVVAYSLADRSLNGINLYESYLYLKNLETQRPIIYKDGGEWNSDPLNIE